MGEGGVLQSKGKGMHGDSIRLSPAAGGGCFLGQSILRVGRRVHVQLLGVGEGRGGAHALLGLWENGKRANGKERGGGQKAYVIRAYVVRAHRVICYD